MDDQVPLHQYSPSHSHLPPYESEMMDAPLPDIYTDRSNIVESDRSKPRKRKTKKSHDFEDYNNDDFGNHDSLGNQNVAAGMAKRIDYVLGYPCKSEDEIHDSKERKNFQRNLELRKKFEAALRKESLELQEDMIGENMFIKIHTPFERLCQEAEKVNLEMPLRGCEIYEDGTGNCWTRFRDKHLETDDEVDFVSAPFHVDKIHIYEGSDKPDTFFRPALRCFLTHHILINMDIRDKTQREKEDDPLSRKGLPYLKHRGAYSDSFILHDETLEDPNEKEALVAKMMSEGRSDEIERRLQFKRRNTKLLMPDTRQEMHDTWTKLYKYQPLWKIRNYFGEKIGLYFAWSGTMITTLWLPTVFGLCIFFYGLYLSITATTDGNGSSNATDSDNTTQTPLQDVIDDVKDILTESLSVIKKSFDNEVTPYFALIICLWGTIFLEIWKRNCNRLAYEWDVNNFEASEPDRPQFFGTTIRPDPVTMEETWYYPMKRQFFKFMTSASVLIIMDPVTQEYTWFYPMKRQFLKFFTSCSVLIVMVLLVFISAAGVILYRVILSVDFCVNGGASAVECLLVTTICSSVLNAVSIMILGKVYEKLAFKLTDWENHRTQTQYDDALILKLFAFQFANSYTSLFYIAFFRGLEPEDGFLGLGPNYIDACGDDGDCMSMLSFQVLVLMIMKPLPKFAKDVIIPWLLRLWRKRKFCRFSSKVDETKEGKEALKLNSYLERERLKPDLGDFTLGEYTEKCIMYGYLMLFACSFPLAPLIALLVHLIDLRVDARRMLWMYRRPVCRIAQDIGMWYNILQFLNICGVISNAFLIAFTAEWGQKYNLTEKLIIVIVFENLVFGLKFFLAAIIPDVPSKVKLHQRQHVIFVVKFVIIVMIPDTPADIKLSQMREKYQVARILQRAAEDQINSKSNKFSYLSPVVVLRNKSLSKKEHESLPPPTDKDVARTRPPGGGYGNNGTTPVGGNVVGNGHPTSLGNNPDLGDDGGNTSRKKRRKKRSGSDALTGGSTGPSDVEELDAHTPDNSQAPPADGSLGFDPLGKLAPLKPSPYRRYSGSENGTTVLGSHTPSHLSYGADGKTYMGEDEKFPSDNDGIEEPGSTGIHLALPKKVDKGKPDNHETLA